MAKVRKGELAVVKVRQRIEPIPDVAGCAARGFRVKAVYVPCLVEKASRIGEPKAVKALGTGQALYAPDGRKTPFWLPGWFQRIDVADVQDLDGLKAALATLAAAGPIESMAQIEAIVRRFSRRVA